MKSKIKEKLFTYYFYREPKFLHKYSLDTIAFQICLNSFANYLYDRTVNYINGFKEVAVINDLKERRKELKDLISRLKKKNDDDYDPIISKQIVLYKVVIKVFTSVLKQQKLHTWIT